MVNPFRSFASFYRKASIENAFRLDGAVPLSKAIPFGIQHVLSMFVSNVTPILLCMAVLNSDPDVTTNAIQAAILMAAVGTTIQLFPIWRIGARLPIVVGISFTFLSVLILVGASYGAGTMFLSVVIGGLAIGILGLFAGKWRKIIKPIVPAIVVLGIGLSLISVGARDFVGADMPGVIVDGMYQFEVGWPYMLVAFITLLSGLLWQIFVKGVWKNISVLVGLVVGYCTALCFIPMNGMVDFSSFSFTNLGDFINVPKPFFVFVETSWSDFNIGAILTVLLIYFVATTEGIGDITSLTITGLGREPTDRELSGGIAADGFISALAGFFGTMPLTTFGQNVSLVGQTKVVNRFVIFQGAIVLFLASFLPPISRALQTIPQAVLGGTMLMLFATIALIGMQMLASVGFTRKNIMIASISIGLGYGVTLIPEFTSKHYDVEFVNYLMLILANPVANMFLLAFPLSYLIPDRVNEEQTPSHP